MLLRTALAGAATLLVLSPAAAPAEPPGTDDDLAASVEVLTEEVRRLKESLALPETDAELESWRGLGPAASKVYGLEAGLSIGGYGEFSLTAPTGAVDDPRTADFTRFITYFGYKFSEDLVMNTELEFEHATTSRNHAGSAGSVSVEFAYLDFLFSDAVAVRAGNLLLPVGLVNQMHEPPFFRGNARPEVERRIIPSTWRELGAGIHGAPFPGVTYELYAVNGLDAARFGSTGIRDGRQKGNRVLFEDVAGVLRVDWDGGGPVSLGGSVFAGGAAHGRPFDGREIDAFVSVAEAHALFRARGFEGRALVAGASIGDAEELSAELSEAGAPVTVPEAQLGWYLEAAQDVAPALGLPADQALRIWGRFERLDLQRELPIGGVENPALDGKSVTAGVEWLPHGSVVVKLDWTWQDDESDGDTDDPLRVGAGFVF